MSCHDIGSPEVVPASTPASRWPAAAPALVRSESTVWVATRDLLSFSDIGLHYRKTISSGRLDLTDLPIQELVGLRYRPQG